MCARRGLLSLLVMGVAEPGCAIACMLSLATYQGHITKQERDNISICLALVRVPANVKDLGLR
jgi:hypothetical protein